MVAEDVQDAVLVGHSLAGVTIPRIMALAPERLRAAVLVSAIVPRHGEPVMTTMDPATRAAVEPALAAGVYSPGAGAGLEMLCNDLDAEQVEFVVRSRTDDSARLLSEPADLSGLTAPVPRWYVHLTLDQRVPPALQDVQRPLGRARVTLATGHMAMVADPRGLAEILEAIRRDPGGDSLGTSAVSRRSTPVTTPDNRRMIKVFGLAVRPGLSGRGLPPPLEHGPPRARPAHRADPWLRAGPPRATRPAGTAGSGVGGRARGLVRQRGLRDGAANRPAVHRVRPPGRAELHRHGEPAAGDGRATDHPGSRGGSCQGHGVRALAIRGLGPAGRWPPLSDPGDAGLDSFGRALLDVAPDLSGAAISTAFHVDELPRLSDGSAPAASPFDVVVELWWPNLEAVRAGWDDESGVILAALHDRLDSLPSSRGIDRGNIEPPRTRYSWLDPTRPERKKRIA